MKRAAPYTYQFESVELRIGNIDKTGSLPVQFTENPLAGTFGARSSAVEVIFDINPPMSGRYLTLQTTADQFLSIDEIYAKTPVAVMPDEIYARTSVAVSPDKNFHCLFM